MAKLQGLSIDIGVTIPDDTVQRCLVILGIWLTDNPNITLEVGQEGVPREDGVTNRFVYAVEKRKNTWEKQND